MESDDEAKLAWLRQAIDIGIADIERGDVIDGEQAVAEARLEYWRRVGAARRSRTNRDQST